MGRHQLVHLLAEQDLALRGQALESRGHVEGVARGERRAPRATADEHLTRFDPELHADRDPELELELGAQLSPRVAQVDRRAHRAQRVVLVDLLLPEHADDRVPDEALDPAAVALDDRLAARRVAVEEHVHRLRVEPLGETGRAHEVGEDDADELAGWLLPRRFLHHRLHGRLARRLVRHGHGQREGGILGEDRALELAQPLAGLDAELLHERRSRVLVGLQRVRLALAAVEGEHQLGAQALAKGVLGDQRLELSHDLEMAAELELCLDQPLDRRHAQVLEAIDLGPGEGLVCEPGKRLAAPECERLFERLGRGGGIARGELRTPLTEQPLEAASVDSLRVDPQLVAVLARHEQLRVPALARERPAQAMDVHLDRFRCGRGRALAPELVDQAVGAERLVRVHEQQSEQGALLAAAERNLTPLVRGFKRTEDAEVHCGGRAERRALPRYRSGL